MFQSILDNWATKRLTSLGSLDRKTGQVELDYTNHEAHWSAIAITVINFLMSCWLSIILHVSLPETINFGSGWTLIIASVVSLIVFVAAKSLLQNAGRRVARDLNNDRSMAHNELDGFMEWKQGDTIRFKKVNTEYGSGYSYRTTYEGVTEGGNIVVEYKNKLYTLKPKFLNLADYKNRDLERRQSERLNKDIKNRMESSQYSKLLQETKTILDREMDTLNNKKRNLIHS